MSAASLRWRLGWLVIATLAVVLVPLGIISFRATLVEVTELSDARLAQSARTVDLLVREAGLDALRARADRAAPAPPRLTLPVAGREVETEVGFRVTDASGAVRLESANFASVPRTTANAGGFGELVLDAMH